MLLLYLWQGYYRRFDVPFTLSRIHPSRLAFVNTAIDIRRYLIEAEAMCREEKLDG
jgi:hypothetical protein